MVHPVKLIAGLANPGKEYEHTRHNAGAWFVNEVASTVHAILKYEARYHAEHAITKMHEQTCHLLIPTTFMNHSGQAVRACLNYHKLPVETVLIAHDDIDLPAGIIRLKRDGGDGGHNGLKDIIRHLHTKQFHRLRIGVGRPPQGHDVVDYVLHHPSKADRQKIDLAIQKALDILPLIMNGNIQKAMQQLHTDVD